MQAPEKYLFRIRRPLLYPVELRALFRGKSLGEPDFPLCFYGGVVSDDSAPKYWEKTRLNNLVRHTIGRYYARLYRNGKEKWQSLKTKHFSVAEAKLAELRSGVTPYVSSFAIASMEPRSFDRGERQKLDVHLCHIRLGILNQNADGLEELADVA